MTVPAIVVLIVLANVLAIREGVRYQRQLTTREHLAIIADLADQAAADRAARLAHARPTIRPAGIVRN